MTQRSLFAKKLASTVVELDSVFVTDDQQKLDEKIFECCSEQCSVLS